MVGMIVLALFIAVWVAVATIAIRNKQSMITAIGGGFLASCASLATFAYIYASATGKTSAIGAAAPVQSNAPDSLDTQLRKEAMKQLWTSQYSLAATHVDFCDPVEEAQLAEVHIGTISRSDMTGDLPKPLPAIKAKFHFVCVNRPMGKRESQDDEWVILAVDDEFSMLRCLRVGYKDTIDSISHDCGFQEAGTSQHANVSPAVPISAEASPPTPPMQAPATVTPSPSSEPSEYAAGAPTSPTTAAEQITIDAIELLKAKRYADARRLFEQAAAQNDARAQTNLGWVYVLGQSVPRDDQRALALFQQAADQKFPNAEDSLGWMYEHGRAVPHDTTQAAFWYKKAADQGFEKSKANLANLESRNRN